MNSIVEEMTFRTLIFTFQNPLPISELDALWEYFPILGSPILAKNTRFQFECVDRSSWVRYSIGLSKKDITVITHDDDTLVAGSVLGALMDAGYDDVKVWVGPRQTFKR